MANDDPDDVDLNLAQQDALFAWQLKQATPALLNESSFQVASLVAPQLSPKVFRNLKKCGVISPQTGALDTTKITKHFANQMSMIPIHTQRKLVGLLFFWEEEVVRWRLLDEEEAEINKAVELSGGHEDLEVALKMVKTKRQMPPSLRASAAEPELPAYG